MAIVRVSRDYIDILRTTLVFITNLNGRKVKINQFHCSGTIKKIEIKARNLLIMWLNSMLKKESVTASIEKELNFLVNKELEAISKLEQ